MNKKIFLNKDMDLSEYSWIPIGKNENYPFSGIFNANGYKIMGLNFKYIDDISYYGLFGYTYGGEIKNLDLNVDINFNSSSDEQISMGALAGYTLYTKIENIKTSGNIISNSNS